MRVRQREVYPNVVRTSLDGRETHYVGIEDIFEGEDHSDFYLIPYSEFKSKEDRDDFIDKAFESKITGDFIEFPEIHAHYVFDLALGYGRFKRSIEETESLFNTGELAFGKRIQGRKQQSGVYDSAIQALEDLKAEVRSSEKYEPSLKERGEVIKGVIEKLHNAKGPANLNDYQYRDLKRKLGEIFGTLWEKSNQESRANANAINLKIREIVRVANDGTNFREIREQLKALQSELKSLRLTREDRDKFWKQLNEAFQELGRRQEQERKKFEEESNRNYRRLKALIDELIRETRTSTDWRDLRNRLKSFQGELKSAKMMKDQRDELWKLQTQAFDTLNERQTEARERFEREASQNYHRLKPLINDLKEEVERTTDFRSTREKLKALQSQLKSSTLTKEGRDELWNTLQFLFERLGKHQDEARRQYEKDCDANYGNLKRELDTLAARVDSSYANVNEVRKDVIDLRKRVYGTRPMRREEKDELIQLLNNYFDRVNERSKQEQKDRLYEIIANKRRVIDKKNQYISQQRERYYDQERKLRNIKPGGKADQIRRDIEKRMDQADQNIRNASNEIDKIEDEITQIREKLNRL